MKSADFTQRFWFSFEEPKEVLMNEGDGEEMK